MDESALHAFVEFWKRYLQFVGRGCAGYLPAKTAAEILTRAMTDAVTEGELSNEARGLLLRESERQYRRERDKEEELDDLTVLYAVSSILHPIRPGPLPVNEILGQLAKFKPFRKMSYARLEEILHHFVQKGHLEREGEGDGARFYCRAERTVDLQQNEAGPTNLERVRVCAPALVDVLEGVLTHKPGCELHCVRLYGTPEEFAAFVRNQLETARTYGVDDATGKGEECFTLVLAGVKGEYHGI